MKYLRLLLLVCCALPFTSCRNDGHSTLVVPEVVYAKPIDEVVPVDLQEKIKVYMPIYNGSTPPNIEGSYLIQQDMLVYTSDNMFSPGTIFIDKAIKFARQNSATNVLTYEDREGSTSSAVSDYVSISGTDDYFSAYFITTGSYEGIKTKTATVISGTKTVAGIENIKVAFIMLDKGDDPGTTLMSINEFRIFKDGDGMAKNMVWGSLPKMGTSGRASSQSAKNILVQ